jgi:hypothetical protein
VQDAISDTYTWTLKHTKTHNPHWKEEGRPTPYEPFPDHRYFLPVVEVLELERIVWIEKSRDLMISWCCVAFLTLKAMTMPECQVLLQTQKLDKAIQLVEYAKCLYDLQDSFLKDAFPLTKPITKPAAEKAYLSTCHLAIAVGTPVAWCPPHRPGLAPG